MHIGFTGTQQGMTGSQQDSVRQQFALAMPAILHQGDCIGADEEAAWIANAMGLPFEVHPPENTAKRAFTATLYPAVATLVHKPLPYLDRNRAIVDACELLIAAPFGSRRRRSGTWYTVRYALAQGKDTLIIDNYGNIVTAGALTVYNRDGG